MGAATVVIVIYVVSCYSHRTTEIVAILYLKRLQYQRLQYRTTPVVVVAVVVFVVVVVVRRRWALSSSSSGVIIVIRISSSNNNDDDWRRLTVS